MCTQSQAVFLSLDVWPSDKLPHHTDPLPTQQAAGFPTRAAKAETTHTSTASSRSRSLAVSWLSKCRANADGKHDECNARDPNYLPHRLIDVAHALKTSYVRVVQNEDFPREKERQEEYITLSHCWGKWGSEQNPKLTLANLKQWQTIGLQTTDLPQTFQDALQIASWFNGEL